MSFKKNEIYYFIIKRKQNENKIVFLITSYT